MGSNRVDIGLLGGFRVSVGGRAVPDDVWRRRKPAALVKILALSPGRRVHREQLIDLLWPDLEPHAAGANLRKAIHQARGALDAASRGAARLIEFQADVVSLSARDVVVDADAFRSDLTAARRLGTIDAYRDALNSYGGELLPDDPYEEWAAGPRRSLHQDHLSGLSELTALLEAQGDLVSAIETARLLVAAKPTREESHVALIRLNALAGRRAAALEQYDHLAQVLDHELGVEPTAAVQRLREEISARTDEDPEWNADLWERVGDLRVLSGDGTGAAKAFSAALDADLDPERSARIERKCAEAWLMQHRPDMAGPHLEAAERFTAEPQERYRLLRARANLAWETGQLADARRFAETALVLANDDGTPEDLAAAHEAIAIVSHMDGRWRDGLESELERLASAESDAAELARVFDIHHCIGQYHLYDDGLSDSVEGYARRILDRAEDVGAVRAQAFAWCLLGEALLLRARWEESDGCLERSCDLHASLGSRSGALAWQRRAELAVCRGNFDDASAYIRRAAGIATVSVMACHLWGRIYATAAFAAHEHGEPDEAVAAVQAAAAAAARYGDCPTCSALLNPIAAEVFAAIGDTDNARYYAEAAGRVPQYLSSSAYQGMAESAAGSVARVEGDGTAASRHFERAHDLYQQAGQPFWAGRAPRLPARM